MTACRICSSPETSLRFPAVEMMYGKRDTFAYQRCAQCGSVQIADIPADLRPYYPDDYYSMTRSEGGGWKGWIATQRDAHGLGRLNPVGALVARFRPPTLDVLSLAPVNPPRDARILDVGCGATALFLRRLARLGFTELEGVDPFIPDDQRHGNVVVRKAHLGELEKTYDLITLHHSFEHMPDPHATMREIALHLAPSGACILRVPTPSSEAFDHYGAHWAQLDAPRHLNLPSRRGLELLAAAHDLQIAQSWDDSWHFQFSGSETIRRGVALREDTTPPSADALRQFAERAASLNRQRRGDQVVCILKHA